MTDERWRRAKALFEAAVERPLRERDAYLASVTGEDGALRLEVESLLAADASDTSYLDQLPVASESTLADALACPPVLASGSRVGPYQIGHLLGTGAMGEVYFASDTNLNRDVALKVLPELFALDADRLTRFKREAQLLATLNHPNIAAIYRLEESNGAQALVLELVEGPTLADRIALGPVSLDESLSIGRQIAEALEAAHEKGIIHRDVKPANIKITSNGVVKVLDFGLAKVWDGAPQSEISGSPRLTTTDIAERTIMGTPAYMSPEQARCKPLDRRTDIWSFGCVLYEMLTGRPPFAGDTIQDTMAAILDREPDWNVLPHTTPVSIRRLLRRCLEKDRKRRLDSARDARLEFDDAVATPEAEILVIPGSKAGHLRPAAIAALAASVGIIATVVTWTVMRPAPQTPALSFRFAIVPPFSQPLNVSGGDRDIALSPDGRLLVYRFGGTTTSGSPLMVRALDQLEAHRIADVGRAYAPFFSPDGKWIGFFENRELKKASIAGGPVVTLCQVDGAPLGASWGDDDAITFATSNSSTGLWRVSATSGGEPTLLTTPDEVHHEGDHAFPSSLPRGRGVLFTITTSGQTDRSLVAVLDSKTGLRKTLLRGGGDAQYVDTGHLVFAAAGTLRAVRFDPVRLEVLGEPVTVVEQVMVKPSNAANYAVSASGTLVYIPRGADEQSAARSLVWVDRKGHEEPIKAPVRTYGPPRLSPDGTRVATGILDQGDTGIWIWNLAQETLRKLTFVPGMNGLPAWSPDGQRIIFMSDRTGILNLHSQAADGSGTVERLTTSATPQWPTSISPDGNWVAGFSIAPKPNTNVVVFFPMDNSLSQLESGATQFQGSFAEFSPNGRYVAYQSDESGLAEVYVRPFPHVERGRWQVSTAGGTRPAWARNGNELFYLDRSNTFTSVPVRTSEPTFIYGSPSRVFDGKYMEPNPARHYDVSLDGHRFLMIKNSADGDPNATPPSIVVVQDWTDELKQRVH